VQSGHERHTAVACDELADVRSLAHATYQHRGDALLVRTMRLLARVAMRTTVEIEYEEAKVKEK